jgi:hypothetical protein
METTGATNRPILPQLQRGAEGICYRAQQLGNAALIAYTWKMPDSISKPVKEFINNCRIEAALVNARALTDFLAPRQRKQYLHHSLYADWESDIPADVTGRMFGSISAHLSHPSLGDKEEEPHPGHWPLLEMAVILLGGLARFIEGSRELSSDRYDPVWFQPSPVAMDLQLRNGLPLLYPSPVSPHKTVGGLTRALQAHLQQRGLLPDELSDLWELQGFDPETGEKKF